MTLQAVRPHPDDESTSTGRMLAYYSARDVRTGVVICTGGEESEIHDPDLDPVADRLGLRELRTQEVKDACEILGVAELWMLGYRDSGMAGTPGNQHTEAFVAQVIAESPGHPSRTMRILSSGAYFLRVADLTCRMKVLVRAAAAQRRPGLHVP